MSPDDNNAQPTPIETAPSPDGELVEIIDAIQPPESPSVAETVRSDEDELPMTTARDTLDLIRNTDQRAGPLSQQAAPLSRRWRHPFAWLQALGVNQILAALSVVFCLLISWLLPSSDTFWKSHFADKVGVVGLVITVIGFIWTIVLAKGAKQAAEEARNRVFSFDAISELSHVIRIMEEVTNAHRFHDWPQLPQKYDALRSKIIGIRGSGLISPEQDSSLQRTFEELRRIGTAVEGFAVLKGKLPKGTDTFVSSLKDQADRLNEIHAQLRRRN